MVVLPWFMASSLRSDGAFWPASVGDDLLSKVFAVQETKGMPPGSYVVMLVFGFWPATALVILSATRIWAARSERTACFLIAWAVPVWLLYEAVPTKLFHYTLPVFPALALLAVGHLPEALRPAPAWLKGVAVVAMLPGFAVGAGVAYAASVTQESGALWVASTGLAALILGVDKLTENTFAPLVLTCAAAGALLHASLFPALTRLPAGLQDRREPSPVS